MNPLCPFCKSPLQLSQQTTVTKQWTYNKNEQYFDLETANSATDLSCVRCSTDLPVTELFQYGMQSHHPKKEIGAGTKLHTVYATDAQLYHEFSCAEDKEGVILNKILEQTDQRSSIIDIGCGTGKFAGQLAKHFDRVYALDKSKQLLEFARSNNSSHKNIEYIWSPAENIPLLDNSVDMAITTWGSFSPNEGIHEMKRILRSGGTILRICVDSRDDLTNLYPTFDPVTTKLDNVYFTSIGFSAERITIQLNFDDLSEAKRILSKITNSPEEAITSPKLDHVICLNIWKKE